MATFKSTAPGLVSVFVQGHDAIMLQEGQEYKTDDPALEEALRANPDLEEQKERGQSSGSGTSKSSKKK